VLEVKKYLLTLTHGFFNPRFELQCRLQPSWEQTIESAEVHILGNRPAFLVILRMLVLGILITHAEDNAGRGGMDIAVFAVGIEHPLIAAVECAYSKLYL